jgi:hypothetical protein
MRQTSEKQEQENNLKNARFHNGTLVVVKITIFRFMATGTTVTVVLAVFIQDVQNE